jgi:hypothetical protein
MLEKKYAKYLTGISSSAVSIRVLVNTPTKVKLFLEVKGLFFTTYKDVYCWEWPASDLTDNQGCVL